MLKLYIGNKNYSSWSMRPWVLLKQAGIPFEEVKVRFDSFDAQSRLQAKPALAEPGRQGARAGWTTASRCGTRWRSPSTWPRSFPRPRCGRRDTQAAGPRAQHLRRDALGLRALRSHCPMNIEASLPRGRRAAPARPAGAARRPGAPRQPCGPSCWREHRGPCCSANSASPTRSSRRCACACKTYALPVPSRHHRLRRSGCWRCPACKAWIDEALAEHDFLEFDEPYRLSR